MAARIGIAFAILAVGGSLSTQTADAAPSAPFTPDQASSQAIPGAPIRDRVIPRLPRTVARAAASVDGGGRGGVYQVTSAAGTTERVRIYTSRSFRTWSATTNRMWAQRFADMPHGTELSKLTVYLSPFSEISSEWVCGYRADSCYDPNDGVMYLSGERPPDGADMFQIAMHEYGHHIANHRSNLPWDSVNWGPKYWATAQQVCVNTRVSRMWPSDAANHYEDHPGEIWAETYRLVASNAMGIRPDAWEILNPVWDPTSRLDLLTAAGKDVSQPWRGARSLTKTGTFSAAGAAEQTVAVPMTLDGEVTATIATSGGLKASVSIRETATAKVIGPASTSKSRARSCGVSAVTVAVRRTSGRGAWTLTIHHPGT